MRKKNLSSKHLSSLHITKYKNLHTYPGCIRLDETRHVGLREWALEDEVLSVHEYEFAEVHRAGTLLGHAHWHDGHVHLLAGGEGMMVNY